MPELYELMHGKYLPTLLGDLSDPECERFVKNTDLTYLELIGLQQSGVYQRFSPENMNTATLYLMCRVTHASLLETPITSHAVQTFLTYSSHLKQYEDLDLSNEYFTCIGKISSAMMVCMDISELTRLYLLLQDVQKIGQIEEFNIFDQSCLDRFSCFLSDGQTESDYETSVKLLSELIRIESSGINVEVTNYKYLYAALSLGHFNDERSEKEKRKLAEILDSLNIEKEKLQEVIDELVAKQLDSSMDKPLPEPNEQQLTSKDDLRIDPVCIHANTTKKVHVYVNNATFLLRVARTDKPGKRDKIKEIPVVVKEYHSDKEEDLNAFANREMRILAFLSGKQPYFLQLYGSYMVKANDRFCFGIVMEHCQTTLMHELERRKKENDHFTEDGLLFLIHLLLNAFAFMARNKIYHLDIKPHNILLSADGMLKIADFNVSKIFDEPNYTTTIPVEDCTLQGTDGYMPPEIQEFYDKKKMGIPEQRPLKYKASRVDVYSLGLTFLNIYTLSSVHGLNKAEHQNVLRERLQQIQILWFRDLVEKMLEFDYKKRMSMKQILAMFPQFNTEVPE